MPAAPAPARPLFLFSVSSIGDLVLATLTFDLAVRRGLRALTVVGPPTAPALLHADAGVAATRIVRSTAPLGWRREVLRQLLAARHAGAAIANLEVYPPRFTFVRRVAALLRLRAFTLDLPALRDDNARSASGEPTQRPHRAHHYARVFDDDGDGEPPAPRLSVDEAAHEAIEHRLRREVEHEGLAARADRALLARPRIVVHGGSTEGARRPPHSLLAATLAILARERPVLPVFVGTPDELGDAMRLEAALPRELPHLNLCGRLPLAELPALVQGAALFVGGDSGPLKIAEAVGARTLSFWAPGATAASFAGPRGAGHTMLTFDAPVETAERAALALLMA